MNKILTNELPVKYSHIVTPDTKFGGNKFKITVVADDALMTTLKQESEKVGVDFTSTFKENNGEKLVTFTSTYAPKLFVREGTTPREKGFAWGGDTVRVDGSVKLSEVMGKKYLSRYINRIELVQVNQTEGGSDSPFGNSATEVSAENFKTEATATEVTATVDGSDLPF